MKKYWFIIFIVVAIIPACSSIRVSQDYDPEADLWNRKTYKWQADIQVKTEDVRLNSPLVNERVRLAIERTLSSRNYTTISEGKPDFYVSYQFTSRQRFESEDVHTGIGFGFGRFGHYGGIGFGGGTDFSEYDEAVMAIDFTDSTSGNLIWRGIGTYRLEQHPTPEEMTKNINETVEKILAQFPPLKKR